MENINTIELKEQMKIDLRIVFNIKLNKIKEVVKVNLQNAEKYLNDALKYIDENHEFITTNKVVKYALDTRSNVEMYSDIMINGWLLEDLIIENLNWYKEFKLELNGLDKNRKFGRYVKADADMKIGKQNIELQTINNKYDLIYFKENKLKKCLEQNSLVLFYNVNTNMYCLLDSKELTKIKFTQLEIIYTTKIGYKIDSRKLKQYTEHEIVNILKYC